MMWIPLPKSWYRRLEESSRWYWWLHLGNVDLDLVFLFKCILNMNGRLTDVISCREFDFLPARSTSVSPYLMGGSPQCHHMFRVTLSALA